MTISFVRVLKWDENQHPRDDKTGRFTEARGMYLARWPKHQPELDAFIAKRPRQAQADLEVLTRGGKVETVREVAPSYEFQVEVEQAAYKRLSKERRQAKKEAKAAAKPKLLEQMQKKYGYTEGDTVFDSQTGAKGKVRWGRDGQPYVESAMGKHLVGARWQKAKS